VCELGGVDSRRLSMCIWIELLAALGCGSINGVRGLA